MASNIPSPLALLLIVLPRATKAFSYSVCQDMVEKKVAQNQTTINGESIYFNISPDANGTAITYNACEDICGPEDNSIVNDWAVRLCSWVLPIIILTFSVQLPPLARIQKLWAVMRLMGDPIGSLMWMMEELRFYQCCLAEGKQAAEPLERHLVGTSMVTDDKTRQEVAGNFTRIFHASSKLSPSREPQKIRALFETAITTMSSLPDPEERGLALGEFRKHVNESGEAIGGLKSKSTIKSLVAIGGFIVPVVIALIPALSPPTSGAMLPPILILSPLLLVVLLNGAIGEYSDLKSVSKVLRDFGDRVVVGLPPDTQRQLGAALLPTVDAHDTGLATRDKGSRFRRALVAVTHFTVALWVMALLAATTCGWLGGCKMWTGYYWYGSREARMPLDLTEIFKDNGRRVYPALATVCLSLNLIAFGWLRFGIFRGPFSVIAGKEVTSAATPIIAPA